MRKPISRVRSVTETSMIFMMPTPPTTSEIRATHNSRLPISFDVDESVLVISVMSRMLKSRPPRRLDAVPLAQKLRHLIDGLRDLLGRGGLREDLVDIDEADRLRRVGRLVAAGTAYVCVVPG